MPTHASRTNSWAISCPRPNPQAALRLFCFPYAGGGASIFRAWPDHLPATIEVCAIQYPGRENRLNEPLLDNTDQLVAALLPAVRPYLDRPFAFFGHSLGALIAFEVARQLDAAPRARLVHLFASARAAPQLPADGPQIHTLPQADFIRQIAQLDGTPAEILEHAELMELLYPILRADFAVNETYVYRPSPPLACPISALGGLRDRLVDRTQLEAWGKQTNGSFAVRMFPGHHFFINDLRSLLLRIITQDLLPALSRVQVTP